MATGVLMWMSRRRALFCSLWVGVACGCGRAELLHGRADVENGPRGPSEPGIGGGAAAMAEAGGGFEAGMVGQVRAPPTLCAVEIATGDRHTCVRTDEGALWCWGDRDGDPFDDGSADSPTPRQVL